MKLSLIWAIPLVFTCAASLPAQEETDGPARTTAMILAPESAKPGELIKLRAQLVNQQDWKWLAGEPLELFPILLVDELGS